MTKLPPCPMTAQQRADNEKARGLAPFIYGGLALAAGGGLVGLDRKSRVTCAGIAGLLFLAI